MKSIMYRIASVMIFVFIVACTDDSKDPFRLNELKKGALLALRGDDGSAGTLNPDQNFFFKDNITGDETFSYVADFISEDQSLLSSVKVFASIGTGTRQLVATIDGAKFVVPSGGLTRQGKVEVSLSSILTALSITNAATLKRTDILISSDIELTDGSTVPASAIVNTGLYAASAFFPAHALTYYAETAADFVPFATINLAGEVVKNSQGKVTSRPVFPLKAGSKDTLYIVFDQEITNTPVLDFENQIQTALPVGATGLPLVKVGKNAFYSIITAQAGYTGAVVATVSGATSKDFGPTLIQDDQTFSISVDNTSAQRIGTSTGTRVGRGQLTTISLTFNEKLSKKSADALKISIDDPNDKVKEIADQSMIVASNGLSASYVFLVEEIVANTAIHDDLIVSFTGGADEAGNPILGGIPDALLTLDVGTPPTPSILLDANHDLGVQIKWSGTQGIGANTNGAQGGTIYFVAIDAGEPKPIGVTFDQDANAIWEMADKDPDPDVNDLVKNRQQGSLVVDSDGSTGTLYTSFTANGTFDVYAVFVGTTGNVSMIPTTPQIVGLLMQ